MPRRPLSTLALALGLAALPIAPAVAQPATERTPNLEGVWAAPPGTLFFEFLHRFQVGAPPTYAVGNVPNFHLSGGVTDWLSLGANYATETLTVPGASQELELFSKQVLWRGARTALSAKESYNLTAASPDVELTASHFFGPVSLLAAVRGMGNYRYSGSPQAAFGLGGRYALTPSLGLAADVATVPFAAGAGLVWGAGAQIAIPGTPHTLSLQVSNAGTETIQGASVDTGAVRYGFAFTVPFTDAGRWGAIFKPAAPVSAALPEGRVTPEAKAFYQSRCAACHGGEGQGVVGPDLTGVEAQGDAFIATRIRDGLPNKGMPAFGAQLSPEELANLVAYVKSL